MSSFDPFPVSGAAAMFGVFNVTVDIYPQQDTGQAHRIQGRADNVGAATLGVPAVWVPDPTQETSDLQGRIETKTGTVFVPRRLADGTGIAVNASDEIAVNGTRYRVVGDPVQSDQRFEAFEVQVERFE